MHDMPRSVREDVSMEECSALLNNIPVFKLADPNFLRQVSLAMSTYVFAPGDIVLYNGDMGREMYCVQRGYVEVRVCFSDTNVNEQRYVHYSILVIKKCHLNRLIL